MIEAEGPQPFAFVAPEPSAAVPDPSYAGGRGPTPPRRRVP
jgi:hypothetical protein